MAGAVAFFGFVFKAWGFREFTHPEAVLIGKTHLNLPLREHPYGGSNEKIKMRLLKIFER